MSVRQTLVAITMDDMASARTLLSDLKNYDSNSTDISVLDAVFAEKDEKGNISIRQTGDLEGGQGALGGGVVGLLTGALVFGPIGAAVGTALGSVLAGLYSSLRDSGMNNGVMRNIVRDMQPSQTTLILLYEGVAHPSMSALFNTHNARLFYTNLPVGAEDTIRTLLSGDAGATTLRELHTVSYSTNDLDKAYQKTAPVYVVDDSPLPPAVTPTPVNMPAVVSNSVAAASTGVKMYDAETESVAYAKDDEPTLVRLTTDDFTKLKGITGEIEQLLHSNNIRSYSQLAQASTSELRNILHKAQMPESATVATWTEQAWLAAQGKWSELEDLKNNIVSMA